jgi:hypothetical protein
MIAEAMLAMIGTANIAVTGDQRRFAVMIGGTTITFGNGDGHAFERLASAIEARIALDRATAMIAAAGETGLPLWLVAGPDMLGKWLAWSRTGKALARVLTLTDQMGAAPVVGRFARRARHALGQMSVKIRVSAGQAVAEQIELSHRVPAVAVLGDHTILRIAQHQLPATLLSGLLKDDTSNDRWRASQIVGHPFFAAHDFMVADVHNNGADVVVELETTWEPLVPIPKAAWAAVPRGADPVFPWRPTAREIADLYGLAARGGRAMPGNR